MLSNLKNRKGAVAIEYGLLAALIALTVFVSIQTLGGNINTVFSNSAAKMATATPK